MMCKYRSVQSECSKQGLRPDTRTYKSGLQLEALGNMVSQGSSVALAHLFLCENALSSSLVFS